MKKGCIIGAIILALIIISISTCGYKLYSNMTRELPNIESIVTIWVSNFNDGKYSVAYNMCDESLKAQISLEKYSEKCEELKKLSGKITLGKMNGFHFNTYNGDTKANISYTASSENGDIFVVVDLHQAIGWKILNVNYSKSTK
jgi:hypothetical protein